MYLLNSLKGHKVHVESQDKNAVFIYQEKGRMMDKIGLLEKTPNVDKRRSIDMDPLLFFSADPEALNGTYLYGSNNLRDFPVLDKDVSNKLLRKMTIGAGDLLSKSHMGMQSVSNGSKDHMNVNMWMQHGGVTTGMHYDPSHNFFLQVKGTKRFLIAPPDAHSRLRLYPFHHPRDRQSQLEEDSSTNDQKVEVIVVDMKPGDLFYLPPYHFHRVVTTTPRHQPGISVGMSVWSTSMEQALSDKLRDIPIFKIIEEEVEQRNKGKNNRVAMLPM